MSDNHRANKRVVFILNALRLPRRSRLLILILGLLGVTGLYWFLGRENGLGLAAGLLAVVMASGFFLGALGGVISAVLCFTFGLFLVQLAPEELPMSSLAYSGLAGLLALILAGMVMGFVRTLAVAFEQLLNARSQEGQKLERRLALEQMISSISGDFSSGSDPDVEQRITRALQFTAEFGRIDRIRLILFADQGLRINQQYQWHRPDLPAPRVNDLVDLAALPWLSARLHQMEIICTNTLSELPPEATKEREYLARSGVESILVYPLLVANQLAGLLGASMETTPRTWAEEDFRLMSQVSEQFMRFLERKAAVRAQLVGEERLRAIFHNAGVGMAVTDPVGIILDSNAELQSFLGYTAAELRGMSSRDFTHPADYAIEVNQIRQAITEDSSRTQIEKRFVRKDGTVVWGILTLSFVRSEQGHITYLIAAVKDITERKRVEQELRSRQSLLEAITLAAEQFLSKEQLEESIRNAIEALGWATAATHVSIFENAINADGRVYPNYRYEWVAPGAVNTPDNDQFIVDTARSGFGRWADLLSRNKIVKARASLSPTGSLFRGSKSILVVPIFVFTRWWGGICVADALHEREWTTGEEDALRLAASLVGLAIQRQHYDNQNRQLLAAESSARKLAEALGKSAADLNASLSLDSVLDSIMANIGKVTAHDAVNIMLVDNGRAEVLRAQGYQRRSNSGNNLPVHAVMNTPVMRQAAESGRPVIVADAAAVIRQQSSEHMQWVRSLATIPIQHQGVTIGFINLQSATPNAFSANQSDTLQAYANQAALALQNARLFETVRENAHRLSILNEIGRIAISAPSLEALLDGLANRVQSLFGMDAAYITLWDEANHRPIPASASGQQGTAYSATEVVNGEVTLTESVLNARRILVVEDAYHSSYISSRIARHFNEASIMGIPLIVGDQKLGALIMGYTQPHKFTPDEVSLAEQAGRQIALAVAKAELVAEVQRLAVTDDLMGLYNYRGLMDLGAQEVDRAQRYGRPLSAIMMDIDRFKTLNDTYSHIVGNEILCRLAERCRQVVRDADIVTRYGGDELCILLVETDDVTALHVAERIRQSVAGAPFLVSVGAIPATVSLGVSALKPGETLNQLIARADRGLYHAKEGGRNRAVFEAD